MRSLMSNRSLLFSLLTAPAAKKGEEDSCQSIPGAAPLNSGLSGFLPDGNGVQKLMRWPERVIIKLGAAY